MSEYDRELILRQKTLMVWFRTDNEDFLCVIIVMLMIIWSWKYYVKSHLPN